ncbi:MAG: hypothetical protein EWV41_10380 [Microcystis wesenbergii Mw_MB_S_20031200_S109]|uniref:Uncharacterized protein n=1 Tax=Microcystis wesenbergii Mw_MB_S_20031200_S109D TaxID=2486241 RepID=A0A552LXD5_9CHRO|nr:MAG: hypothetical protein EWV41_10380 [Microcystis wesenbergii Mw_MB_S_20031200_S109]TRV24850.1 MAG: hypothetical protein EWV88_08895 [Microcystis wesenbergii Mw_MB_S_20031200_S109D]
MNQYIISTEAIRDMEQILDYLAQNNMRAGEKWFFGLSYAMDGVIRNETLIETDITAIFVNCLRSEAN